MPRLWAISDLHAENLPGNRWPVEAPEFDVLVVAGDIYEAQPIAGVEEVARLADGRPAIVVLGNWDYSSLPIEAAVEAARRTGERLNVHILEASSVHLEGLTFAGGTLWNDHFPTAPLSLEDAMRSRTLQNPSPSLPYDEPVFVGTPQRMRPATYQDIHLRHEATIAAIAAADADVVVTHFPPTPRAFAAAAGARLYHYGHVHSFERRHEKGMEIVLNPRQSRVFAPKLVVDVEPGPRLVPGQLR